MEPTHVRLLILVVLVLLVSVATSGDRVTLVGDGAFEQVEPAAEQPSDAQAEEIARVRDHLMRVESELLGADIRHLTLAQQQSRAENIRILREYRGRGIFPRTHEVAGVQVPVFIDSHGTPDVVGYLIARSGHETLARRIADLRSQPRVRGLADIPELVAWLADAGLTVEEAERIQPVYAAASAPNDN